MAIVSLTNSKRIFQSVSMDITGLGCDRSRGYFMSQDEKQRQLGQLVMDKGMRRKPSSPKTKSFEYRDSFGCGGESFEARSNLVGDAT
jgi:hypothetical protein